MRELTDEIKKRVEDYVGKDCSDLSEEGFWFYEKCRDRFDLQDAESYARVNTIMGFDIGLSVFNLLNGLAFCLDFDLSGLSGKELDKEFIAEAYKILNLGEPDFSKWRDFSEACRNNSFEFVYFNSENDTELTEVESEVIIKLETGEYIHMWFSMNEAATEGCDSCIGYQFYDTARVETEVSGEFDYNSESQNFVGIKDAISEVLDFIYGMNEEIKFKIVCKTLEDFYK